MIDNYDYVIIGGGTAGCRLAARLAGADIGTVALVEAGEIARDVRTIVPQWYLRLFGSRLDWKLVTDPIPGLQARRLAWPRGRLLGGSGAINASIYLQAACGDFDRWGWEWAERLLHRSLLPHARPTTLHPWSEAFIEACSAYGLTISTEFTRATANTAGAFWRTHRDGRRLHAGQPLLEQTLPRLRLLTGQNAERIELSGNRASGVQLRDDSGSLTSIRARREVIVCCGTLGTPWLLMRSGIGPKDMLDEVGWPCHIEAPGVGSNLQDHLVFPVIHATRAADGLKGLSTPAERQTYRRSGDGPLASNLAEAGCLVALGQPTRPSSESTISQATPGIDAQIHFTPTHYLKFPRGGRTSGSHCTLAVTDLHPISRGRLAAVIAEDGQVGMSIQPNCLASEEDVERMLAAIRFARSLVDQQPLRHVVDREELPGGRRQDDASLTRAIRAYSLSIYHPVGTCRMESEQVISTPAVVDRQFRALGVECLRIADASVLPDLPSCNTNAVVLLLAERLADLLSPPPSSQQ
jgi:choline dehydrogenase